jgi:hypothetical protein
MQLGVDPVTGMQMVHQLLAVLKGASQGSRYEVGLLGGQRAHVGGLGPLAALGDIELDGLAFFQ